MKPPSVLSRVIQRGLLPLLLSGMLSCTEVEPDTRTIAPAAKKGDTAALAKLSALALKDDSQAQFILGGMYADGDGVSKDDDTGLGLDAQSR